MTKEIMSIYFTSDNEFAFQGKVLEKDNNLKEDSIINEVNLADEDDLVLKRSM